MEVSINNCDQSIIDSIKAYLGKGEHSPNWEKTENITIGFSIEANGVDVNAMLWQGTEQRWCLGRLMH
jgi:hypothetical protein